MYGWSDGPGVQEVECAPGPGGGLGGIVRAGSAAAVYGRGRHRRRGRTRRSRPRRGVQAHVPAEADHDVRGVDPGGECRLPGMATHPLRRLEVRRFGPLSEADLNFSGGINVVVGDNDAGKSQTCPWKIT